MGYKRVKGEIQKITIVNPIYYDYNDIIFQIEIQEEDGWNAQLMFKSSQIINILEEFDVRFASDLPLKECYLLESIDDTTAVPLGIKYHNDSDFIPTQNDFFAFLWK